MKRTRQFIIFLLLFVIQISIATPSILIIINGLPPGQAATNANLAVEPLQKKQFYKKEHDINRLLQTARRSIRAAIKPFGYFSAHIDSQKTYTSNTWILTFNVDPGPRIKVNHVTVTIKGNAGNNKHFKKLLSKLPIKVGQPLNTKKYNQLKQRLTDLATQLGYFNAKIIKSNIIVNLKTHKAKIIIIVHGGLRSRFGVTSFSPSLLAKSFLKRFLFFKPGDYYDQVKIQKTQQNLISSDYFTRVLVSPITHKKDKHIIPVNILLTPQKSQKYIFGAGYGTDTGIRGTAGIKFNRLNQYGHKLDLFIQASKINSNFITNYLIPLPGANLNKRYISVSSGLGFIDIPAGTSQVAKLAAGYTTNLGNWQQNISLVSLYENYNLPSITFRNIDAKMIYPSIQWTYRQTDRLVNPDNGYYIKIQALGSAKPFVSAESFFQASVDGRLLYTFDPTHTRLLLHSLIAKTFIGNLKYLPLSLQLFAGGAQSIRGFSFDSIRRIKNLVLTNIEIQQKIYGNWYLAGFCDTGFTPKIYMGVGPAIVWLSPVGRVALSLGFKMFNDGVFQRKPGSMIQFSVGPYI